MIEAIEYLDEAALAPPNALLIAGPAGLDAYHVALSEGFVGTAAAWLDELEGDKGDKGDQGLPGDLAAIGPETDLESSPTGTTVLAAIPSACLRITGTNTILSFGGTSSGHYRILRFAAALNLVHNATSLVLPGGTDITTAPGDIIHVVSDSAGNWRVVDYQLAARGPLPPTATPAAQGEMSAADKSKLDGLAAMAAPGFKGRDSAGPTVDLTPAAAKAILALKAHEIALDTESDLASAATTDLGSVAKRRIRITGTTTITSFGTGITLERIIRFASALTLTHNAVSLILPGSADINVQPGDVAFAASNGSGNWRVLVYQRADGTPLVVAPLDATSRRNLRLTGIRVARALGEATRFVDGLADGIAGTDGLNTGASSGYVHDPVLKRITNSITKTVVEPASNTTAAPWSASTIVINRSFTVPNSVTVASLGLKSSSGVAATGSLGIFRRNSAGNYTCVAKVAFSHAGDGSFVDYGLGTPYAVPASGDHYLGAWNMTLSAMSSSGASTARATLATSTDPSAGDTLTGVTEGTGSSVVVRVTHTQSTDNMTLTSVTTTADAVPSTMQATLTIEPVDAIVLGTDVTLEVTRDGTTWTAAALTQVATLGTRRLYESAAQPVTGQPSGTSVAHRLKTLNNKMIRVHGLRLDWG